MFQIQIAHQDWYALAELAVLVPPLLNVLHHGYAAHQLELAVLHVFLEVVLLEQHVIPELVYVYQQHRIAEIIWLIKRGNNVILMDHQQYLQVHKELVLQAKYATCPIVCALLQIAVMVF